MRIFNTREIGDEQIGVTVENDSNVRMLGIVQNGSEEARVVLEPHESEEVVLNVIDGVRKAVLRHQERWEKGAK